MKNITLSDRAQAVRPGIYEHYKGQRYRVLGVAHHSETLEEVVVYQACTANSCCGSGH